MGHYTTLTEGPSFRFAGTWEEFMEKWRQRVKDDGEYSCLDLYDWELEKQDPDSIVVGLKCESYYAKHYSDRELAQFISTVIAEDDHTILEYADSDGDGGHWGYYITRGNIKPLEYVRMLDGKLV